MSAWQMPQKLSLGLVAAAFSDGLAVSLSPTRFPESKKMTISKQDILNAYHFRHACKAYDPQGKISDEDFRLILETGRLSPSSFGFEPWKFLVIDKPEIRELIRDTAWGARDKVMDCSRFVVIIVKTAPEMAADGSYIWKMMRETHQIPEEAARLRRGFYKNFTEHDFELAGNNRAFYDWACKQSYIALGNMLTTAAMLGIDSTPIEGFPLEETDRLLAKAGLYNRNEYKLSVMAAFGRRINEPRGKTRRAFEEVIEFVE